MRDWTPIIYGSECMKKLVADLDRAASAPYPVMLLGEKGTGKTLVAELMHRNSARAGGPFIHENCANIAPDTAESILFGHKRGSFTGAIENRMGLFHAADGGTLFLDEVAELPRGVQAKLLVAVEKGRIRPLGSRQDESVNVRFISATNRNLAEAQANGYFRGDLLDRLNVLTAVVPPLRERREDIGPLAQALYQEESQILNEFNVNMPDKLPDAVVEILAEHDWPGNVRELRNAIIRLITFCPDGNMEEADVLYAIAAPHVRPPAVPPPIPIPTDALKHLPPGFDLAAHVERERDEYIDAAVAQSKGNKAEAARLLGMSRQALHKALERRSPKRKA
jgi:two-component system NtrC family response regulator